MGKSGDKELWEKWAVAYAKNELCETLPDEEIDGSAFAALYESGDRAQLIVIPRIHRTETKQFVTDLEPRSRRRPRLSD